MIEERFLVKGRVCPHCGGPLRYTVGYRADGGAIRKAVVVTSPRRLAPDDRAVPVMEEGSGFKSRPSAAKFTHVVTCVCDRCHMAFSDSQTATVPAAKTLPTAVPVARAPIGAEAQEEGRFRAVPAAAAEKND